MSVGARVGRHLFVGVGTRADQQTLDEQITPTKVSVKERAKDSLLQS